MKTAIPFDPVGPRACVVCCMPHGVGPDRAFLMGMAVAHQWPTLASTAFEYATGMCPHHAGMFGELVKDARRESSR